MEKSSYGRTEVVGSSSAAWLSLASHWVYPMAILVLASAPRFFVAFTSAEVPSSDAAGYDMRAQSILSGQGFAMGGKPTSYHYPFYSIFLASVYFFSGHSYLAVRLIQAFLGILSCYLLYLIGKKSFGAATGFIAAVIMAFNPAFIKSIEHLTTEALFTFIFLIALYLMFEAEACGALFRKGVAGFMLGLMELTRSVVLAFPFFFAFVDIIKRVRAHQRIMPKLTGHLILILFMFAAILPWTIRNYKLHGEFIFVTTRVGINLYSSFSPKEGKLFGFTASDDVTKEAYALGSEVEANKFLIRKTLDYIKDNPGQLPYLTFLKFAYFWVPFDWEVMGGGRYNFAYGFSLPFFLIGFVAWRKRAWELLPVYLSLIYFLLISLITYGSPRLRLPIEPVILLFAALGISSFFDRFRSKAFPLAIILTVLVLNLLFYFYSQQVKLHLKLALSFLGIW